MMSINPHLVQGTMVALPVAVAVGHKLLQQHNKTVPVAASFPTDQARQIEKRANTLTETLRNIVGYPHHGLNE